MQQENSNRQSSSSSLLVSSSNNNNDNKNETACDVIRDDIPKECTCQDPNNRWSFVVECLKTFNETYFNDTIGMKIDVDPCDPLGSKLDIEIVELKHQIDYRIAGVRTGEEKDIPIPGLSIVVPALGHVGLDTAVYVGGNLDQLTLKVGLNACAVVHHNKNVCASSIPGLRHFLPWWVLKNTYSFGHLCNTTAEIL